MIESTTNFVPLLGIACAILVVLGVMAGIVAAMNIARVREFQTLLHKAERKIDQLERRMFHVLNAVPVALVETDNSGKFTFANKAAYLLLGRKDTELLGLRYHAATWGITYPDGRVIPQDLMPIARTLRGQTVKGFQHLLAHPQTLEKMRVSVTSMPITNANGEVIGSTSAIVELETQSGEGVGDITGIWRGQWFTQASSPFFGLDQDGIVLDINAAALELLDLKRDEAIGHNWAQFFVDDADYRNALDYLAEAAKPGNSQKQYRPAIHIQLKGSPTRRFDILLKAWKVVTLDGLAEGLTIMAEPAPRVAEAKVAAPSVAPPPPVADTRLILTEDQVQDYADLKKAEVSRADLGIGVWFYDPQSDSIVEDIGMRRLIGRTFEGGPTLIPASDQARADEAFGQIMNGETLTLDLDLQVDHPDGPRWIALKGRARPGPNGPDIYGIATDITAIRAQAARETAAAAPPPAEATKPVVTETLTSVVPLKAPMPTSDGDVYIWQDDPNVRIIHVPMPVTVEVPVEVRVEVPGPAVSDTAERDAAHARADALAGTLDALRAEHSTLIAANHDLHQRLDSVESDQMLTQQLNAELDALRARNAELAERASRLDAALALAQRYETVGRLTGNVAHDFAQMLNVINNALDMIQKQSHNPEHIRRLSEAALAAGRRGERLTRQLEAFAQAEEEPAQ